MSAVMDAYPGMNFDKYPVIPLKTSHSLFTLGSATLFAAFTLSNIGFRTSFVQRYR